MADSCSDAVDGEISEGQKLNKSRKEDPARVQEKEISSEVLDSYEQSSPVNVSHVMKDDITPRKDPPTTTTSSLKDDANAAQSFSVISQSRDKTEDSEIINSQSHTPSQSEVTPTFSMASLEFSEETNGVPPDGTPISTESAQDVKLSPDKVPPEGASAGVSRVVASEPTMPAYYFVKWITWKEKKTAIITQSENGPCPLIAIMNILLLRWKVSFPRISGAMIVFINEILKSVTFRNTHDYYHGILKH